jgi:hypothetical protein
MAAKKEKKGKITLSFPLDLTNDEDRRLLSMFEKLRPQNIADKVKPYLVKVVASHGKEITSFANDFAGTDTGKGNAISSDSSSELASES